MGGLWKLLNFSKPGICRVSGDVIDFRCCSFPPNLKSFQGLHVKRPLFCKQKGKVHCWQYLVKFIWLVNLHSMLAKVFLLLDILNSLANVSSALLEAWIDKKHLQVCMNQLDMCVCPQDSVCRNFDIRSRRDWQVCSVLWSVSAICFFKSKP